MEQVPADHVAYSLALDWAFFRMGSILVAFITSPLTLSFPDMNRRWALALPAMRLAKSVSDRERVTAKVAVSSSV